MENLLLAILLDADYRSNYLNPDEACTREQHLDYLQCCFHTISSKTLLQRMMMENQWCWDTAGTDIGFDEWQSNS